MIQKALEIYGCIYISKASQLEHDENSNNADDRYLTKEGAALVSGCIRKNILMDEWVINPFNNENEDYYND